jgi:hypothetical protein
MKSALEISLFTILGVPQKRKGFASAIPYLQVNILAMQGDQQSARVLPTIRVKRGRVLIQQRMLLMTALEM